MLLSLGEDIFILRSIELRGVLSRNERHRLCGRISKRRLDGLAIVAFSREKNWISVRVKPMYSIAAAIEAMRNTRNGAMNRLARIASHPPSIEQQRQLTA